MTDLVFYRDLVVVGDWKLVWGLNVPPKVKDFLWRACRDSLPTKVTFFKRNLWRTSFVFSVSEIWRQISTYSLIALLLRIAGRRLI